MRRPSRGKSWIGALFSPKHRAKEAPETDPSASTASAVLDAPEPGETRRTRSREEIEALWAEAKASVNKGAASAPLETGLDAPQPSERRRTRSREEIEALWAEAKAGASKEAAAPPLATDDIDARIAAARRLAASVSAAPAARAIAPTPEPVEAKKNDLKSDPETERPVKEEAKQETKEETKQTPADEATKEKVKATPEKSEGSPHDDDATAAAAKLAAVKEAAAASEPAEKKEEDTAWKGYWRKMGGGSLLVSLGVHIVLLILASLIVSSVVKPPSIDFLSGGGSKSGREATQELAERIQMKKRTFLQRPVPLRKVVSQSATAIALPELAPDTMPVPQLSSLLGGTMGSGGFGSGGAGGGAGDGLGPGSMSGRVFKPITMFGNNLKARSIAVILDVSGSMTPHLAAVVKELDRVARNSPVVLYVGCGVEAPPRGIRIDDDAMETRRRGSFDTFWNTNHGNTPDEKAVYDIMVKRPFTYFIKDQGINYAWVSLLAAEVRNAEALYWFSDFQDQVDDEQLKAVLENLKRRRQKLFIHASEVGNSFEEVRDKLALPSGGSAIQSPTAR
jgi:hypothetical protein